MKAAIDEHMRDQPYAVWCKSCGKALEFDADHDELFDLMIRVNPCGCVKNTGKEEATVVCKGADAAITATKQYMGMEVKK